MALDVFESKRLHKKWRELLQSLQQNKREIVITKDNEPVATIISYEDYLAVRDELNRRHHNEQADRSSASESLETMLASEHILTREWNTSQEDEAWADL